MRNTTVLVPTLSSAAQAMQSLRWQEEQVRQQQRRLALHLLAVALNNDRTQQQQASH